MKKIKSYLYAMVLAYVKEKHVANGNLPTDVNSKEFKDYQAELQSLPKEVSKMFDYILKKNSTFFKKAYKNNWPIKIGNIDFSKNQIDFVISLSLVKNKHKVEEPIVEEIKKEVKTKVKNEKKKNVKP